MMSSSGGREQLHIVQRERGGKTEKVNVRLQGKIACFVKFSELAFKACTVLAGAFAAMPK